MSNSKAIIDYEKQLKEEAAHLKETLSAPSSNKISTKGKLFTLPDGSTNNGPLECVILDYLSYNSWYPGAYDPQNLSAPSCWAIGRVVADLAPSEHAPDKQGTTCDENGDCPQAKWNSAAVGKGKACKNIRRLIIVPPGANADTEPMTLEVSPGAIRAFDAYVTKVNQQYGSLPIRVVTSIGFDANKTYPSLTFSNPQPHDNLELMMALRQRGQDTLHKEPIS